MDLQRNAEGVAILGDPRNDEKVVVSQLQRLFARFHNAVYDDPDFTRDCGADARSRRRCGSTGRRSSGRTPRRAS
ncbi:hypothetical protein CNY89_03580 [Amaricoccus sp. HAR-UPW-R2A-40]|nr:hypothetical protein CNY89_03580 [Amaricoccus sp. HAR-UPW-R2A-40]